MIKSYFCKTSRDFLKSVALVFLFFSIWTRVCRQLDKLNKSNDMLKGLQN